MRQIAGGPLVTRENGPVTYSLPARDRLLDVKEAAALLNVPESWIYQHVRARSEDKLPHIKLGKYIRFSTQALIEWLGARQLGGDNTTVGRPGRRFSEAKVATISRPRGQE
jgi:excisionase family DNA binding protein